jgi:hypothetical protein
MKNPHCYLVLFVTALFVLNGCTKDDEIDPNANCNICPKLNSDTLLLNIGENTEKGEKLEIACPVGVRCDENFDYRAYYFNNTHFYFYISFDPNIINNYSLESFREYFNYLNFSIYFPERNTTNSEFLYSNITPVRQLNKYENNIEFTIDSYENGNIQGTIKGTITEIDEVIHSDSPDCYIGDMLGICIETEEANIPFRVNYSFLIN